MASNLLAMASTLLSMASNLLAMASSLLAMASNLLAMASNLLAMTSALLAMASNLLAMASTLVAMASNLVAMASLAGLHHFTTLHITNPHINTSPQQVEFGLDQPRGTTHHFKTTLPMMVALVACSLVGLLCKCF